MKSNLLIVFAFFSLSLSSCTQSQKEEYVIQEVAELDTQLDGISAPFAGTHGDYIIVAGGCNFPEIPVADGGKKKFYSGIYIIHKDSLIIKKNWTKIGELTEPLAYGTSITIPDGLLCIGGMNEKRSTSDVFLLQYDPEKSKISQIPYPSLPLPTDNSSGTLINNHIYLSGGNSNGRQSNQFIELNLEDTTTGWKNAGTLPENLPRVQPVLLSLLNHSSSKLLLTGGYGITTNNITVHTDCWEFDIANKSWQECSAPLNEGHTVTFTGATGTIINDTTLIIIGGVNTNIFHYGLKIAMDLSEAKTQNNINGIDSLSKLNREYLTRPPEYYQFNQKCWLYNSTQNKWQILFEDARTALAGAVMVSLNDKALIINGEIKPGIRTKKNYLIYFNHKNTHQHH